MIGIGAGESQATAALWRSTYGLTHPVLADPTSAVYSAYGNGFVPYNAIIDGEMVLQYSDAGFNSALVIATIEQLLADLLWIEHVPLKDSEDVTPYGTVSTITSEYALVPAELLLRWNLDGGSSFNDVVLTSAGGDDYTGEIPAQVYGTTVYYFITASDTGGRTRTHPADAPTALHSFYVGVDSTPPVIDHEPLGDQVLIQWPSTVSATVTDNQDVDTVTLEFMINGGPAETVPMVLERDGVYSADFTGSASVGDMIEYRITAMDVAVASNTTVDPTAGYHTFSLVDPIPAFIFEPDGVPQSGAAFGQALDVMGIDHDMGASLPSNPSLYSSIFACLGVFATNHILTSAEGQALADFLDLGGRLYMEGGDTWYYDSETPVHPYFMINGLSDGGSDAGPITGAVGTFTDGMLFQYSGGNSYMDRISPIAGAEVVFQNLTPPYMNGISYDGGTYRTIGTSFKFGGLVDGAALSTKDVLLENILEYFDLNHLIVLFADDFESGDDSGWSSASP